MGENNPLNPLDAPLEPGLEQEVPDPVEDLYSKVLNQPPPVIEPMSDEPVTQETGVEPTVTEPLMEEAVPPPPSTEPLAEPGPDVPAAPEAAPLMEEPTAPPAAPAAAPEAASPPASEVVRERTVDTDMREALIKEGLTDYVDPALLDKLREQAEDAPSIAEIVALGGLAAANPKMAQFLIQQRTSMKMNAQETLAKLQQQEGMFRREQMRQQRIYETERGKQDELRARYELQARSDQVNRLTAEAGKFGVELPPIDLGNVSDEQWLAWQQQAMAAISGPKTEEREKEFKLEAGQKGMELTMEAALKGASPKDIPGALAQNLRLLGYDIKDEDVPAEFPDAVLQLQGVAQKAEADRSLARTEARHAMDIADQKMSNAYVALDQAEKKLKIMDAENALTYISQSDRIMAEMTETIARLKIAATALKDMGDDDTAATTLAQANAMEAQVEAYKGRRIPLMERAYQYMEKGEPSVIFNQALFKYWDDFVANLPKVARDDPYAWLTNVENRGSWQVQELYKMIVDDIMIGRDIKSQQSVKNYVTRSLYNLGIWPYRDHNIPSNFDRGP